MNKSSEFWNSKINLLEAESEIRFRHVLAERNAVSVVGRIAVQASDVLVAVGHAVTGTERHVETIRSEQTDVADSSVPCYTEEMRCWRIHTSTFFALKHLPAACADEDFKLDVVRVLDNKKSSAMGPPRPSSRYWLDRWRAKRFNGLPSLGFRK